MLTAWLITCEGQLQVTSDARVTHMLHAYDMCITANHPTVLQIMLDSLSSNLRLHGYAQKKGLIINVSNSEVVHFNSKGDNAPTFTLGGTYLVQAESF
eukprot:853954-Pelagomonas_calceolata.AAC.1